MDAIPDPYQTFLDERKAQGLYRRLAPLARGPGGRLEADGRSFVNFASNDYLGLSFHPEVIGRAQLWTREYGAGAGASRLVTGNLEPYARIEEKLAAFKGLEAALVMASGFQANASVLPALFDKTVLGAEPLVFADRLVHASALLGCAAAGVSPFRYRHNDMPHLESLLQRYAFSKSPKFILTESVFSMDGDRAPMEELRTLADTYEAFLIVDEAHATGILGENGKGLAGSADLIVGTFSKGLGSFGAYIACSAGMREYLVNKCAGLIYATALPPAVLGAIDAALDLVPGMDAERAHVAGLAGRLRAECRSLSLKTGLSDTHIVPVIVGEALEALDLCECLKTEGLWSVAIRPPTVPKGFSRVRFSFCAPHGEDDFERLARALRGALSARPAEKAIARGGETA